MLDLDRKFKRKSTINLKLPLEGSDPQLPKLESVLEEVKEEERLSPTISPTGSKSEGTLSKKS